MAENAAPPIPKFEDTCFVISPIGKSHTKTRTDSDKVFKHIISPAAIANGLTPLRSDMISAPGVITTDIISQLLNARMVIADLTDHNANVFYELAIRHAFHKPVTQLMLSGQQLPFDVAGMRTIFYTLDLDGAASAQEELKSQIQNAISDGFVPRSPISETALKEQLTKGADLEADSVTQAILEEIAGLNRQVSDLAHNVIPELNRNAKPVTDQLEQLLSAVNHLGHTPPGQKASHSVQVEQIARLLESYSREIDLISSARQAGVVGIFKKRENAMATFASAISEEQREIMVIGSSLKGLLQKGEFRDIGTALKRKVDNEEVTVKFLLTHPIVADFRAKQENRAFTAIGEEIVKTLEELKEWKREYCKVRMYVGTPTCFAIKTSQRMLINPYPYVATSYESPCLVLERSQEVTLDRQGYFFDVFNERHFGAWETDLSVEITDFQKVIDDCKQALQAWSLAAEQVLAKGKGLEA